MTSPTQFLSTYLKPSTSNRTPNALDVIKYRQELATALAQCGSEYPKGVGYAFLVEDIAGYRKRMDDPDATKPVEPNKPTLPGDHDGTAAWKRYAYQLQAWQEWNTVQGETMVAITDKFPTMLSEYKDKTYNSLPRAMTPAQALSIIYDQVFTDKAARELYARLLQEITALQYKPVSIGPAHFFQDMVDKQFQANRLGQSMIKDDLLMTFALKAFCESGHDPATLNTLEEGWWTLAGQTPAGKMFLTFRHYWIKHLAASYNDANKHTYTAHLSTRLSDLERSVWTDVSQLFDNQTALESAFQTVTQTTSMDTPSVLSTVASSDRTDAFTQFRDEVRTELANLTKMITHSSLQASQPNARNDKPRAPTQWRFWCYTCGVNLHHNTADCRKKPKLPGHTDHLDATMTDPQGGNTKRNHLWHKWCHPVTNMPMDTPN